MNKTTILTWAALVLASSAFAHEGVKNPAVKARMDSMSGIGAEMKIIGQMAKGQAAFDQAAAQAAAAAIAEHAAETPALFEANEDDPKSEAKAAIWENFRDFSAKASELEETAINLSTSITTKADLTAAMTSLGSTCQACHKAYRE